MNRKKSAELNVFISRKPYTNRAEGNRHKHVKNLA